MRMKNMKMSILINIEVMIIYQVTFHIEKWLTQILIYVFQIWFLLIELQIINETGPTLLGAYVLTLELVVYSEMYVFHKFVNSRMNSDRHNYFLLVYT